MTSNAYQLWLKKREFKAPRLPPSPSATPTVSSRLNLLPKLPQAFKSLEDARNTPRAVSAVETTLKCDARPSAAIKWRRSWNSSREEATGCKEKLNATKVAGCAYVAGSKDAQVAGQRDGDKVAQRKRQQSGQELIALMRTSASKMTSQLSVRRMKEREEWTKWVDAESKWSLAEESEEKESTRSRSLMPLKQMGKRRVDAGHTYDGTTKRLRFDADTEDGDGVGSDGVEGVRKLKSSYYCLDAGKTMRTLVKHDDCTTTIRLRGHCGGNGEERKKVVESSGLPPKSPMKPKQKDVTISMLDESQYWMAVERFSHLT